MAPLDASLGVLRVGSLEELSPVDLRDVSTVVFGEKGAASHIEVICRIRGIKLVPESAIGGLEPPQVAVPRGLVPAFQASVSAASELAVADFSIISDVFVRIEHLLYHAVWEDRDLLSANRRSELKQVLLDQLKAISGVLPDTVNLLVRGLDVRSDDGLLRSLRDSRLEANPELGLHGASWLAENDSWVDFESDILASLEREALAYGVPFVRGTSEFQRFQARFGAGLPELVPFIETPASLSEFKEQHISGMRRAAIGLKDLTQFYFASDRANPRVASHYDLAAPMLVDLVVDAVETMSSRGVVVSVYQQPEVLTTYAGRLESTSWLPSMAIGTLNEIG